MSIVHGFVNNVKPTLAYWSTFSTETNFKRIYALPIIFPDPTAIKMPGHASLKKKQNFVYELCAREGVG